VSCEQHDGDGEARFGDVAAARVRASYWYRAEKASWSIYKDSTTFCARPALGPRGAPRRQNQYPRARAQTISLYAHRFAVQVTAVETNAVPHGLRSLSRSWCFHW